MLVDPACSGLRFLACASLLACSLAAWMRLGVGATVALLALSVPATFVANVLRVSSLFFLERANLDSAGPSFLHAGVGLVAFALACLGLVWAASRIQGPRAIGRAG